MELPLQLTFRGLPYSDALAEYIHKKAGKLDTFYDRIMSCRVAFESLHQHKHEGRPYRIRIDVGVPGDEIVVSRDVGGIANEDAHAAIDAAFDAAQRRLHDHAQVRRGDVKTHEHALRGEIVKLFTHEGYGFIRTQDGDEIYFHKNSVLHDAFGRLKLGAKVRFAQGTGDDGIHATSVALLRSRGARASASA
jgi:cold shock CspA family protein/ribosome-associated translation inhibitor RaiA